MFWEGLRSWAMIPVEKGSAIHRRADAKSRLMAKPVPTVHVPYWSPCHSLRGLAGELLVN